MTCQKQNDKGFCKDFDDLVICGVSELKDCDFAKADLKEFLGVNNESVQEHL